VYPEIDIAFMWICVQMTHLGRIEGRDPHGPGNLFRGGVRRDRRRPDR
jgi:hypothetical protein